MTRNPDTLKRARTDSRLSGLQPWQSVLNRVLAALMVSSLVFLAERIIIQLISINYHRTQFGGKIRICKRNVHLLGLLYEASTTLFPAYCPEFVEEDSLIGDSVKLGNKKAGSRDRSGSTTPLRLFQDVGRFGDKITAGEY